MRHRVFSVDELEPGQMRSVRVDGVQIVVVRTREGEVHALRDRCSHHGAPLSGGAVEETVIYSEGAHALSDDKILRCPWHGFEFDLATGRCLADPQHHRVRAYQVVVEEGDIFIER